MKDMDDKNPKDGDDKKKPTPTPAGKYKQMKKTVPPAKDPLQSSAADPSKALSPTNPLMVEKADGSVGQWGNPIDTTNKAPKIVKKPIELSDKARGLSNNYYRKNF